MRMETSIKDRMSTLDINTLTPNQLINARPVMGAIKEFYGQNYEEKIAPDAFLANDLLLISHPEKFIIMRDAIFKFVQGNKKNQSELEESYQRILKFKKLI